MGLPFGYGQTCGCPHPLSPFYLNTKSTWFGRLVNGLIDRFGFQQMALRSIAKFVYAKRRGTD